jgi:hypothetical protein
VCSDTNGERICVTDDTKNSKARVIDVITRARIRGIEIELRTPSSASELKPALEMLLSAVESESDKIQNVANHFSQSPSIEEQPLPRSTQDPYSKIATDLGISPEELKTARIVGFKEGKPQILSPSKFATPEKACLALFYSFEIGLDKSPINFEEGEEAYSMSRYTEPFAGRILSNLKISNKINRSRYDSTHEIALTPSGVEDARHVLKAALTGEAKKARRRRKASKKR